MFIFHNRGIETVVILQLMGSALEDANLAFADTDKVNNDS